MKNLPEQQIKQLVNLIAQEDNKAITTLYNFYSVMVRDYIFARTNNAALADEATNDVFQQAIPKITTYNFSCKFSTWLLGYAINITNDHLRKLNKYHHETPLDETHAATVASGELPLEDLLQDKEKLEILNLCVSKLGNDLRATYSLMYVAGLSIDEIMTLLEVKQGTVKSRLFNIRAQLKQCVRNLYP